MRTFLTWLRGRTPVLREMYPIALPFIAIAITVWTIVPLYAALIVSVMALTVVAVIVWASWGRDDEDDGVSPSPPDIMPVRGQQLRSRSQSPSVRASRVFRLPMLIALSVSVLAIAGAVVWGPSLLHDTGPPRVLERDVREVLEQNPGLMQPRETRSIRLRLPAGDYSTGDLRVTSDGHGTLVFECTALTGVRGRDIATHGYNYYRARLTDGRLVWETRRMDGAGLGTAYETIKLDIDTGGRLTILVECPIPAP